MKFKLDLDLDRNPTLARIRSLKPTARYGLMGVGILFAYVAIDSWSWSWARSWNAQADRIESILSDSAEIMEKNEGEPMIGPETFGPVFQLGSESEGAQSMAKAVVEIEKKYSTSNFSYDAQRASTRLTGASANGEKISKVSGELQFECSPEVFSKIIADIESSSAIESISSIRLQRKEVEKKLAIRMTIDAWVIPGKSARPGGTQ